VSPGEHLKLRSANQDLQRQIADLGRYQKELEGENARLRGEVEALGRDVADADYVRKQKEELARLIEQFQIGGTKEIPGVSVIRTSEGVAFQVQGEVLFASGQAEITPAGKETLRQLLPTLLEHGKDLRIDGHTDSDPIRHSSWQDNLSLSFGRGRAVLGFLTENGIDAERCFVAAYGPYRPAVVGNDDAAKRQNRRVEILMLEN
jgi:chemotaxis protein MotB